MFKLLFTISGLFAVVLGLVLVIAPHVYLALYVPQFDEAMVFAAQRLAPAIIGLGALLLLARDLPAGPFAARFAVLSSLVWFGVACTGVFHFATGVATSAILIAALIEVALGVLFVLAARQMRHG
ncbi:hypothetical protein L0664_05395 [Octadecabacter sp. G9-8]|uniref:DUF4345 domain-containing protein n=1 Tax=Octadecabacter dasysiphoniae TaxID=2909341 RepID=A0ABS9CVS7_9RHOB|nr:hypothetical protein [Octadecabacter dasysiphoniae]MCF2870495.1 hypothetical protein [Octadecabacter dasysiphoniae]